MAHPEALYSISTLVVPSSSENLGISSVEQTMWERVVLDLDRTIAQSTTNNRPFFIQENVSIVPVLESRNTANVRRKLHESIATMLTGYPHIQYVSLPYGGIFHTRELLNCRMSEAAKTHMSVVKIRGIKGTEIPEALIYAHLTIVHDNMLDKGAALAAFVAEIAHVRRHTPYDAEFVARFTDESLLSKEKYDLNTELIARMEQERVVLATPVYKNPWFTLSMNARLSQNSDDERPTSWAWAIRLLFPHRINIDPTWWLMGDGLDTGVPVSVIGKKSNLTLRVGSTIPGLVWLYDTRDAKGTSTYDVFTDWIASTIQ
jgi:hypothetical protein